MAARFRVGLTRDILDSRGEPAFGQAALKILGVIGAGRIGKELLRMARVFDLKLLAADPYVNAVELAYVGARKVPMETLLRESDFVVTIPLLAMDNVIVTPHSLCWTDECFHHMASTGLASIVDALGGRSRSSS